MTKPQIKGPLTILGLSVENFKRVSVVNIRPDGSLVEVAGENGQGKSSVLDAIWAALGGAESFPDDPVRTGQQEATIKLDMGEIKVTRRFKRSDGDKPYTVPPLVIEAANGARFDKPQTILDQLVGKLTFEPMGFMELGDKEKFAALKVFVPDVDFDAIEGQNQTDFDKRTDENRRAKELRAQAAGIIIPPGEHKPVDVAGVLAELEEAEAFNKDRATRAANRTRAENRIIDEGKLAQARRDRVEKHKAEIAILEREAQEYEDSVIHLTQRLAEAGDLPEEKDTAALRDKIADAAKTNDYAKEAARKATLISQADQHEAASQALTEAIDARKENIRAKIASAKMPVHGLSLEDGGRVLLNGVAFDQASTAEKLKTSIAVAMAMNPTVRVIRITKGGNDLDKKSMKVIAEMAAEHGYQIWCERVEAAGRPTIIMEDGHAKS